MYKSDEKQFEDEDRTARTFDYPIFLYDISKARTLLRFESEWNVLNGVTDMIKEL